MVKKLGRGAQGSVFLVKRSDTNKEYVLKKVCNNVSILTGLVQFVVCLLAVGVCPVISKIADICHVFTL